MIARWVSRALLVSESHMFAFSSAGGQSFFRSVSESVSLRWPFNRAAKIEEAGKTRRQRRRSLRIGRLNDKSGGDGDCKATTSFKTHGRRSDRHGAGGHLSHSSSSTARGNEQPMGSMRRFHCPTADTIKGCDVETDARLAGRRAAIQAGPTIVRTIPYIRTYARAGCEREQGAILHLMHACTRPQRPGEIFSDFLYFLRDRQQKNTKAEPPDFALRASSTTMIIRVGCCWRAG
ncbi:hypothetical protein IWX49DRAFT_159009 [Phyllosticta citricarpa]|uniref:Uncharacterized protein n=1 Tax=Phyllosticta paracitricarpa TaxID=2016321 RepID=A0ABR1N326_9PEZI